MNPNERFAFYFDSVHFAKPDQQLYISAGEQITAFMFAVKRTGRQVNVRRCIALTNNNLA